MVKHVGSLWAGMTLFVIPFMEMYNGRRFLQSLIKHTFRMHAKSDSSKRDSDSIVNQCKALYDINSPRKIDDKNFVNEDEAKSLLSWYKTQKPLVVSFCIWCSRNRRLRKLEAKSNEKLKEKLDLQRFI